MSGVVIRPSLTTDMPAVADLRRQWDADVVRTRGAETESARLRADPAPADEIGASGVADADAYAAAMTGFALTHDDTHHCVVGERDGRVVAMAWLALTLRPPVPGQLERWSGDLQSVYVVPEERGAGVASRMVRMLLDVADGRGASRVTVHSSAEGLAVYERLGFAPSRLLLQRPAED